MKDSQTELEEHICYLKHRVETLEALYRGGSACLDSQWAEISEALRFG